MGFQEPERRSPTRPVGKYSPASSRVGDQRSNGLALVQGFNARIGSGNSHLVLVAGFNSITRLVRPGTMVIFVTLPDINLLSRGVNW